MNHMEEIEKHLKDESGNYRKHDIATCAYCAENVLVIKVPRKPKS